MGIIEWSGLFIISLAVLLQSAKYFTETAEKIGVHFKIPPFIIGVTILAIGTSLPEIVTSVSAVLQGEPELVIGNVAGSNMANILLVLAITAIVGKHLVINKDIKNIDLPILLASTILLFITTLDGKFGVMDATLSLLTALTYIVYNIKSGRRIEHKDLKEISKLKQEEKKKIQKDGLHYKYPLVLLASGTFLYFSAEWTIRSVVEISTIMNIATEVIAVSAIAIGTSLPELVVSVVAAKNGKVDIAIGNVTGSNIFNALVVMGIPALFGTLTISADMIAFTIPALVFTTILYFFITMDQQISQWEGVTLLVLYVAFIGKTFGLI